MAKLPAALVGIGLCATPSRLVLAQDAPFVTDAPAAAAPSVAPAAPPSVVPPPGFLPPPGPGFPSALGATFANVNFVSEPAGLSFHRLTSLMVVRGRHGLSVGRIYQPLCSAPCTLALAPGMAQFAVSYPGKIPRLTAPVAVPSGTSEVHGYFDSHAEVRAVGWVLMAASVVAGATLMAVSFSNDEVCNLPGCSELTHVNSGMFIGGAVLLTVGTGVGIALALTPDVAHVEVRSPAVFPKAPRVSLSGRL